MEALKYNQNRIINLKLAKKLIFALVFILIFDFFLFPVPILAAENQDQTGVMEIERIEKEVNNQEQEQEIGGEKQENEDEQIVNQLLEYEVNRVNYYTITAYNSEVAQCDSTPCITANGFNVCEHGIEDTVAANFLPFGTKIRIPDFFGEKVFIVRDRMNAKYQNRLDVWMISKRDAKIFGIKVAKVEILK